MYDFPLCYSSKGVFDWPYSYRNNPNIALTINILDKRVLFLFLVRRNFRGKFNAGKLSIPNWQSFGFCFGEYHLKKQRNAVYTEFARLRNLGIAFSFSLIKNVCQRVSSLLEQIFWYRVPGLPRLDSVFWLLLQTLARKCRVSWSPNVKNNVVRSAFLLCHRV